MVLEQETNTAGRIRRVALASAIGTTIEWYDYFAYSTATALVFNKLFFPSLSPASGTLAAFATLGVGFVARPLGGIVWGHFGDRVGRKAMLVASLVLMGLATAGVGALPTYHQAGVIAPVLLVVLRVLQGISAGGEWGGAALMAVEHAPEGKRGRYGSFSQIGVPAGLILAQLVFFAVNNSLSPEDFRSWGWRIPFLVSLVLVAVGLVIRLRVEESPVFAKLRSTGERSRLPIVEVLRARPKQVLAAAVSFIANTALGYIFFAYLLSYGTSVLKLSSTTMLVVVIVGSVVWLVSIVAAAIWSDSAGRKPVYLAGSVLLVVWSVPFFLLVDTAQPWLLIVAVVVLNIGLGATYGPQSALFSELFESRFRYSGSSFAYAVGAVLGGGFAPLIAAALQSSTGTSLSVSLYMVGVGVLSLLAVLAFPRKPLVAVTAA
ncbi:MHS family MFS transporter [Amycolatopsis rubida]|uniref:Putative proline/betaine transporter n=1 Tax=Amycolatopsis rubida TaxID=112413 RepID=A0A1I5V0U3_9PSEU|nr:MULTISPECIES: MFS transporter [Amycolatopsis]MYW89586.1 MFS transporter [Amycolatopsis rubida]NEC54563.1 MHS family MFS transporter [Amycolatopsis rubida]OAP26880.1 Inner membrane metabolite transport protein YhjE [Amycolatopsis sp. M39]SFQ01091.1 metabolite-proton symporter [Amycolatopsis rubida]